MDADNSRIASGAGEEVDDLTGLSMPIPVLELSHEVASHGMPQATEGLPMDNDEWMELDFDDLRIAHRALISAFEAERNVRLQMEEMLVTVGRTLREVRREKLEVEQRASRAEKMIASSVTSKWKR